MRLRTVRTDDGGSHAEIRRDGHWYPTAAPDVGALLARPDWRSAVTGEPVAGRSAPVVTAPRKIVCCGHNYRAHIAELGRAEPEFPTLFAKFADTLTAWDADITLGMAAADAGLDWEAELAVVVGVELRRADRATARAGIAGYTVANDFSVRTWQRRTAQWLQGKAFDATTPLGPDLVTPDEADPGDGLRITCRVNGVVEQCGSTYDLLFDPGALLSYISAFTTLRPGDVVLTGTPGGVGVAADPPRHLRDGDVVETEIEGIGLLRNRITLPTEDDPAPRDGKEDR
ncbi:MULTISPECIES: fumarylacetoacetate hydrolase family protein [Nocardia]|uniref:fumarylacetoacetate hydrolase family protein n=1 Tax=Nocardia TaxID=1817 RepID=UPI000A365CFF|nr:MULTISPECIES: fumarylacetoacetate hydrolase family protein [Nocardia]MBF6186172.1 fumarylacetoacetate hydrolase family protein [Nocardia farcinica]MBF6409003.1 fumarylacetoacetate hydrolase family protein [Nocardia farcinica]PEH79388.1 FAA hydrolase family protein [Nocardia sp. FDAARGOS_372]